MKLVSSRERYRCKLFWVTEDFAQHSTGFEIRRSIVRHAGSAVMMAVDNQPHPAGAPVPLARAG
jgi:ADP-ribose pyrophosphatase